VNEGRVIYITLRYIILH